MIEFAQRVSTDNIIPLRDVPPPAVPLAMLDLQFVLLPPSWVH